MKIINVKILLIFFDFVVWLKWMEFSSIQTEQHFTPRIQTWLYLKNFHLVQLLPGRFDPISMFVEVAFLSIQTEQQLTPRIQTWLYLKVSHHFQLLPVRFDLIWRFRIPSRPNEVDALVIFDRCRRHYRLHVNSNCSAASCFLIIWMRFNHLKVLWNWTRMTVFTLGRFKFYTKFQILVTTWYYPL